MKANEGAGDFTRFLWLPDPTDPESKFQVYRFKTVLFGSTSSLFMLNATSHCHLRNHSSPIAKDIKDNVQVDNIISGYHHQPQTVQYYSEARSIMTAACFNVRSWASKNQLLRERAAKGNAADASNVFNILGLKCNLLTDTLSLKTHEIYQPPSGPITKCTVLQIALRTYDPLVLLSPVTIKARLLMQELYHHFFSEMNHIHPNSEPNGTVVQKKFTMRARSSSPDITSQTLRRMPPQSIYMYLGIAAPRYT